MANPDHPVLEWRGKLVDDLTREELIELVGVLHTMVWASSENFERLLTDRVRQAQSAGGIQ